MYGLCDVKDCNEPTYMGWRPLTEHLGRQICRQHWRQHLDEQDGFDLYDVFNFERPASIPRRHIQTGTRRGDSSRALPFFAEEAKKRLKTSTGGTKPQPVAKMQQPENRSRYGKAVVQAGKALGVSSNGCRQCGQPRRPGHTYCDDCMKKRKAESNRKRQKRHYLKMAKT